MASIGKLRSKIKMATEMHDLLPIARRYFIIGAFDGALTIMGIILGAYAVGELSDRLVIVAGFAAGIALAVSSAVGAYEAERIESAIQHRGIERAMLTSVEGMRKETAHIGNMLSAIIHGISPLIGLVIPLVPFFFLPEGEAMTAAIIITISFLFAIGAYLGSIIKETILYTGLRFAAAGLLTAIIVFLLGGE